ncbi:hypothetical protein CPB85DRAFT_1438031 [Mucidula mucida]|nr:hypothetical protein CPB85DRAFT_1438031 [Mucidula mucida]
MILERLSRDATSNPYPPARFPVYPLPGAPRSRPPKILDVTAVFLQREDIDLDAHITHMVPPELLLALLMLSQEPVIFLQNPFLPQKKFTEILRPYARRLVDVSNELDDQVVSDSRRAFEAVDTYRIPAVLLLVVVAAVALYLYVAPPALRLSIQ